ncbi:hypothetical protein ADUPG1_007043 [Aduncisulcus paluster]|uniref:Uncharacterized protein n=1 Tax=Aduncisulcus paluster TaxID=2918883 RepID=A0ABQ5KKI7_9EUKA|nr:hypothetical protein ADUPG1_007043 [Aduncisulcus paluster]
MGEIRNQPEYGGAGYGANPDMPSCGQCCSVFWKFMPLSVLIFFIAIMVGFILSFFSSVSNWLLFNPPLAFEHLQLWRIWTSIFLFPDYGRGYPNFGLFIYSIMLLFSSGYMFERLVGTIRFIHVFHMSWLICIVVDTLFAYLLRNAWTVPYDEGIGSPLAALLVCQGASFAYTGTYKIIFCCFPMPVWIYLLIIYLFTQMVCWNTCVFFNLTGFLLALLAYSGRIGWLSISHDTAASMESCCCKKCAEGPPGTHYVSSSSATLDLKTCPGGGGFSCCKTQDGGEAPSHNAGLMDLMMSGVSQGSYSGSGSSDRFGRASGGGSTQRRQPQLTTPAHTVERQPPVGDSHHSSGGGGNSGSRRSGGYFKGHSRTLG